MAWATLLGNPFAAKPTWTFSLNKSLGTTMRWTAMNSFIPTISICETTCGATGLESIVLPYAYWLNCWLGVGPAGAKSLLTYFWHWLNAAAPMPAMNLPPRSGPAPSEKARTCGWVMLRWKGWRARNTRDIASGEGDGDGLWWPILSKTAGGTMNKYEYQCENLWIGEEGFQEWLQSSVS